ncbi:MAG: hypothetical protein AB7Q97_09325 [Gammaproteobacteria bacterium]
MNTKPRLPAAADFPVDTEFVIYEFDIPLANVPGRGWFSWWGGVERPFDPRGRLKPDNNWNADSFEQWLATVQATMT